MAFRKAAGWNSLRNEVFLPYDTSQRAEIVVGGGGGEAPSQVAASNRITTHTDSRWQYGISGGITFGVPDGTLPSGGTGWGATNASTLNACGALQHLQIALGNNVTFPQGVQFARGGNNTRMAAADAPTYAAFAKANAIDTVIIQIGVNDMSASPQITQAQSLLNYRIILDAWHAEGIKIILLTELPRSADTFEARQHHHAIRDWLRDPARLTEYPGIRVIDTWTAMWEPGTPNDWKPGYAPDTLHPLYLGGRELGRFVASQLGDVFPLSTFPTIPVLPTPATAIAANYVNHAHCMLTGTAGTRQLGATGVVPTGWQLSPISASNGITLSGAMGTNPDGHPEFIATITSPGTTAQGGGHRPELYNIGSLGAISAVPAGTRLRVVARVRVDAGAVGLTGAPISIQVNGTNVITPSSGSTPYSVVGFAGNGPAEFAMTGDAFDGIIMTPEITLPANWDAGTGKAMILRAVFHCAEQSPVNAVVRVSQIGVQIVT